MFTAVFRRKDVPAGRTDRGSSGGGAIRRIRRSSLFRSLFAPPVFPGDREKTRQARLLHRLLLASTLLMVLAMLLAVPFLFAEKLLNSLLIAAILGILCLSHAEMRAGRVRLAGGIFVFGLWPVFTVIIVFAGGMQSAVAAFYVVLVVVAGLLLGFRSALVYSCLCALGGLAMVLFEAAGRPLPKLFPMASFTGWIDLVAVLLMTTLLVQFALTDRRRAENVIGRQFERLRALHTIEQAITSTMDLPTILDLLARDVVEQLHMDAAAILLREEEAPALYFGAGAGFRTGALRYTRLKFGEGLAGRAAETGLVVHIPDLGALRDLPILSQSLAGEGFVAYFGLPLIADCRLGGVLEIFHRSPFEADTDWLVFLETLAGQAAIAIHNARLLDMTRANLMETEALYRINRGLAASVDSGELMREVVTLLQTNFGYRYVQIYVRDPASGDFILRAGSGETGARLIAAGHRLAAGEGIIGYTAGTDKPFLTNDVNAVPFFRRNPLLPEIRSELAVPIRVDGRFIGLLDVQQAPPQTLSPRDLKRVEAVADQLAVALQKTQLYTDLQNALGQEKAMRAHLIHSEKLAVTGRLMASVSHELNNPLQAMQNALFLLREERTISPQAKKDLAIVLSQTERMAVLLDRLRTTYKPARTEDFQPVPIGQVIRDVQELLSTHMRHARISCEFSAEPGLPTVSGVRDQLRQVILNLFMNAVDAMPDGGTLAVSAVHWPEDGKVVIEIADTGTGIDPAVQPHLFEMFVSGKENGTGLGLAICREIVENHGGSIRAENRPQGGALFRIGLPAAGERGA
jgi:signal transduction histidine kinase